MLSLPLITPRDSHELWFGSSQPYRSSPHYNQNAGDTTTNNHHAHARQRNNGSAPLNSRTLITSTTPANGLSALLLEERALRARKQNIASFGYSWIKPAGCAKTMLGMKEEEAEREEAMAAAAAELAAAAMADQQAQMNMDGQDEDEGDQTMERDLDDYIPDADAEGLVEEGEEGLEEDDVDDGDIVDDEDGFMERDLDDDIPEAFPEDDDEDYDFDDQPDLDDEIPQAGDDHDDDEDNMDEEDEYEEDEGDEAMARDLDDDIPEAGSQQEDEWQHTDTDAEIDDDDDDEGNFSTLRGRPFGENVPTSASSTRGLPRPPPTTRLQRQRNPDIEIRRPFMPRWSGGDPFDSSGMMLDDEDLRASITSTGSRRSIFSRRFPRRYGGPRDSLE